MNRAEKLGAQLVMALRARSDAQARIAEAESAFLDADQVVEELQKRILTSPSADLYVQTAEIPQVPDDRPTEQFERDIPCPGPGCNWYTHGLRHAHMPDGAVWNLAFGDGQESAYPYPS